MTIIRANNRATGTLRPISIDLHATKYAEGSCYIRYGDTHVLCTASIEERVPPWLRGQGQGWISAEYGMLPRATHSRVAREAIKGKQSGRSQEIQRLIGRSMRSALDLKILKERTIMIDCDVIQADGGTRTAAITGAYVALNLAVTGLVNKKLITRNPIITAIAAVSCGIVNGTPMLDLDYSEDSNADADANFVLTASGQIVEIQATAEKKNFSPEQMACLFTLAQSGIKRLFNYQQQALGIFNDVTY